MLRRGLAAQEHGSSREALLIDGGLDASIAHECKKGLFISFPAALMLLIGIEYVLRRGEQGFMLISGSAYLAEKVSKVGLFGKCR